jgi:hypothetical protein
MLLEYRFKQAIERLAAEARISPVHEAVGTAAT